MNLDPVKLVKKLSQSFSLEGFKKMLDKSEVRFTNPHSRDLQNLKAFFSSSLTLVRLFFFLRWDMRTWTGHVWTPQTAIARAVRPTRRKERWIYNGTTVPCNIWQHSETGINLFPCLVLLTHSESRHCPAPPGWLPWFKQEVHALAGGAHPGRADQEQQGCSAEVCTCCWWKATTFSSAFSIVSSSNDAGWGLGWGRKR